MDDKNLRRTAVLALGVLVVLCGSAVATAQGGSQPTAAAGPNVTVTAPDVVGGDADVTARIHVEGNRSGLQAVLRNDTATVAGPVAARPNASGVASVDLGSPEPGQYELVVTRDGTAVARQSVRVSTLSLTILEKKIGYDAYGDQADYQLMNSNEAVLKVRVHNAGDAARNVSVDISAGKNRTRRQVRLEPGQHRNLSLEIDPSEKPGKYPYVLRVGDLTRRGTLQLKLASPATATPPPTRTSSPTRTDTTGAGTDTPASMDGSGQSTPGFGVALAVLGVLAGLLVAVRRR